MKKFSILFLVLIFAGVLVSQESIKINEWMMSAPQQIYLPVFSKVKDIEGKTFELSDLLKGLKYNKLAGTLQWKKIKTNADGMVLDKVDKNNLIILKNYLSVNRWTKGILNLSLNALFEVYLDDKLVKSKTEDDFEKTPINLELNLGKHRLMIKIITAADNLKVKAGFEYTKEFADCQADTGLNPVGFLTINDILTGDRLSSASISPSGRYVLMNCSRVLFGSGESIESFRIYDMKTKKNIAVFSNKNIPGMKWLPRTDRLSYTLTVDKTTHIYLYDLNTGREREIAAGIKGFSSYTWSPAEDFIIYSEYRSGGKLKALKRIYGVEDRLSYFRGRSYLHKIDLKTGQIIQLTAANLSASLQDIKGDGSKILFSTSRPDYLEVPFYKQNLYELDLRTFKLDTVWKDKLYAGYCQYSPDGTQLLVQGGPECFGDLGVKVIRGRIPNSYDSQLYIFNLTTKKASPLTRDFDPAVNSAYWSQDGSIYLNVTDRDYQNLYRYRLKSKKFSKINLAVEVLASIDYAYLKPQAVYTGTSISSPNKLYALDLKKGVSTLLYFPLKKRFNNISFGKNQDWNFVNKKGTTIYGRIYYPPGFDKTKKYPVIVNFYGGTSPIERSFGGRYPINIWAANGYLVYILQPGGATGFGQDFSALHVNGWGFDAIDDIIEGTSKFLKTHSEADAENVGCIGASYGGYTTMLVQTRTDIFKTAISHAGISSITSYWGQGNWGYTYNTGAAKFSYPWNRKDIYVNNSPLYNADKFENSILLLHGTDDTNVPVGESLQYYAALKLLGKDVEMVLVDKQNHWIVDYQKRIKWHYTIMSWFDKKLKSQPQQWENLYPKKNL